ncbi:MAG: 2-oxoacid:acceptor oxidoreductase family protein [Planctomycetota bacterium]
MNQGIRFTGFGGQGIILAGYVTGKAASLYDNLNATLTQNYGPESRGGACSAQLIISDEPVSYPELIQPDILVALSQEGYYKYKDELKTNGILLIEDEMVYPEKLRPDIRLYDIPAGQLAEKLGKRVVTNMIILGFLVSVTKVVSEQAMKEAIRTSVPPGTEELNLKAYWTGLEYGNKIITTDYH